MERTALRTAKSLVTQILLEMPSTRSDDNLLYQEYFWRKYKVNTLSEIAQVCVGNEFETVRRARQKIQQTNPFLWANPQTRRNRKKAQEQMEEEVKEL